MPRTARYPHTLVPSGLIAVAGILLTIAGVGVLTEVPLGTTLALAALVVWQSIAGLVLWRWLRPASPALELFGAALAVGTMVAALAGVVTATIGLGPWGWVVPSLVAIAISLVRRTRGIHTTYVHTWSLASVIGFFTALLPGLAIILYALRSYPLTWVGTWTKYHPDMPFFEAISVHLAQYGAFATPFLTEGSVRYHWLSYVWAGQLTIATDAAPFVTITRVLSVVALLGSSAMIASWTHQLSKLSWTPALAGLLLSVGGFTGAVFGGAFSMDSPSQSMSVLWLIAFSIALIHLVQSSTKIIPGSIVIFTLSFGLIGGKVSAAAPAVAGALVLAVISVVRRDQGRRAVALFVATIAGSAAGFGFFLYGSLGGGGLTIGSLVDRASSQQGLNPIDTPHGVIAGTLILALAVMPRWAGLAWLVADRRWRWRPEVTYSLGLAGSSLVALLAFNSFNEVWFSSTVSGPLAAITAVGVGAAVQSMSKDSSSTRSAPKDSAPKTALVLVIGALMALAIFALVWQLWATGASGGNLWVPTWRWLGPPLAWVLAIAGGILLALIGARGVRLPAVVAGIVVLLVFTSVPGRFLGFGTGLVGVQENGLRGEWFSVGEVKYARGRDFFPLEEWTESRMQAAHWLRENTGSGELLGTNLTLGPFVPGVSHRPTYVSAIGYQSPYGPPWMSSVLLEHEDQIWSFIEDPSPVTIEPLCAADVRWLWIDLERAPEVTWEPYYTTRVSNADTVIAELNGSSCIEE